MSHRIEQLEATIQRRIGELLARGLADPRVRGMITVTEVKLSEDQSQAVIGISVLPEEHSQLTLKGVTSAAKYLRRELAATLTTRRVPRLIFKLDDTLKKQAKVIAAVNQAMAETGQADPDTPDTPTEARESQEVGRAGAAKPKHDAPGGPGRGADDPINPFEQSSPIDENQNP